MSAARGGAVARTRVEVAGARPRLLQAGPEDSPEAVVFVHGNPGSADDWEALIGAAAGAGKRALALDLPDFGETEAPPGFEHTVPGYAGFLAAALGGSGSSAPTSRSTTSAGRSGSSGRRRTPTRSPASP